MKRSSFLTLNWRDLLKGLLLAVVTAVITFFYNMIQTGVPLDVEILKKAGMVAIATVLAYLLKNLFENNEGTLVTSDK